MAVLWDSADVRKTMKLAAEHGLEKAILDARRGVGLAVFLVQCAYCMAAGDSRTSGETKIRPAGHPEWGFWAAAHSPHHPGYELGKEVMDAIVKLKASPAVADLAGLTSELSGKIFRKIPGAAGAKIRGIDRHPLQDLGLQSAPLVGKNFFIDTIPLADWTPQIHRELEGAIAKLKTGIFGNPVAIDFHKDGRDDFMIIMRSFQDKKLHICLYLIACGINRFDTFHAKGMAIAAAVHGAKYSKGGVKNMQRVLAKCGPGGDYAVEYDVDGVNVLPCQGDKMPECMHMLDILRGTVICASHGMMLEVRAKAIQFFKKEPAVLKDRRMDGQHDMLLVFEVDGMYCELQLHYEQTMCIKSKSKNEENKGGESTPFFEKVSQKNQLGHRM
jgi:hypothetical protein